MEVPAIKTFPKRTYRGFGQFFGDLHFLWKNRRAVRRLMRGEGLDPKFRERVMLAVTEVNNCRHCTRVHTRMALDAGMEKEDVDAILKGCFNDVPEAERTALLFGQHWAETEGNPDPAAVEKLESAYGKELAEQIQLAIRVIKTGNYTGNTFDCFLYKFSFGRWGGLRTAMKQSS